LIIIIYNRVIFFFEAIKKIHPSGSSPKNCRLFLDMFLIVILPPISDMGKGLNECKGDFLIIGKFLDREITL
jgi:hypothetical protein